MIQTNLKEFWVSSTFNHFRGGAMGVGVQILVFLFWGVFKFLFKYLIFYWWFEQIWRDFEFRPIWPFPRGQERCGGGFKLLVRNLFSLILMIWNLKKFWSSTSFNHFRGGGKSLDRGGAFKFVFLISWWFEQIWRTFKSQPLLTISEGWKGFGEGEGTHIRSKICCLIFE